MLLALVLVFVVDFLLPIITTDVLLQQLLAKNYDIKHYRVLLTKECREHTEPKAYYVIPIAELYEVQGVLFRVDPCTNVSID